MQIRGLLPPWCECNVIDQEVPVYGLLKEIEWQSVFRNCAKVVRAKISCRDQTKIPLGRLFNFHGTLFQLQFTIESASDDALKEGTDQYKDTESDGNGNNNGINTRDSSGDMNPEQGKNNGNGKGTSSGNLQCGGQHT
jgi:hypothetical protein